MLLLFFLTRLNWEKVFELKFLFHYSPSPIRKLNSNIKSKAIGEIKVCGLNFVFLKPIYMKGKMKKAKRKKRIEKEKRKERKEKCNGWCGVRCLLSRILFSDRNVESTHLKWEPRGEVWDSHLHHHLHHIVCHQHHHLVVVNIRIIAIYLSKYCLWDCCTVAAILIHAHLIK